MRLGPIIAAVLLIGAGAGTWIWIKDAPATQQEPGRAAGKGKRWGGGGDGPVPVTVVPVSLADVPVHREGIGNVQALAAVTVRSQVDGKLLQVEFTEGQEVKKGQILARVDPSTYKAQLDQAAARKAQNEATLANARLDLERAETLMAKGAGNRKTEDTARAQVRTLEAQVKADEAAIDNARAVLSWTDIMAPIDGRVGLRMVDPGNLLRGDQSAIVSIMQVAPIGVVFTLPQRDLPAVSAAMARGEVPVEIMAPDGKSAVARGELATVDNQIDQATGTIKLKAHFPNEERRLWPGQFVSVRVVVDTIAGARVIPTAAVRRGPPGTFVYVVGADEKVRITPVKLALESEAETVVAEGLEPGARVVTVGFARLTDGRMVHVTTPGAPKGEPGERRRRRDGGDKGPRASDAAPSAAAPAATPGQGDERAGERRNRDGEGGGERRRRREAAGETAPTGNGAAGAPAAASPTRGGAQ